MDVYYSRQEFNRETGSKVEHEGYQKAFEAEMEYEFKTMEAREWRRTSKAVSKAGKRVTKRFISWYMAEHGSMQEDIKEQQRTVLGFIIHMLEEKRLGFVYITLLKYQLDAEL